MILQALCEYYDRKQSNPETALAEFGFEEKEIPFFIILDNQGLFISLEDAREMGTKGKPIVRSYLVPKAKGRSGAKSYETANCLWDHYGYLIQQPKVDKPDSIPTEKEKSLAKNQHDSFKKTIKKLFDECPADAGIKAVWTFLNNPNEIEKVKNSEHWHEVLKIKGCNLSFKLVAEQKLICQSPAVIDWIRKQPPDPKDIQDGICLVTGEIKQVVRLHDQISGVNQKPAPLASINEEAYNSFNKTKAFNFPVSVEANFKYTTALNYLLRKASNSKFRIGDTSYVCWSNKENQLESSFANFFNQSDDPDAGSEAIKALYGSLHNGAYTNVDGTDQFYILALSPNSARISIRFWHSGTVARVSEDLGQWFNDLQMVGVDHYDLPSLKNLLRSMAFMNDEKNLPPNLSSDLTGAILANRPLPQIILHSIIRRLRAEQGRAKYSNIDYFRVSLLKSYFNRKQRELNTQQKDITVRLNTQEDRIGYRLGRLFALLEKLQKDAQGETNSTIADRYYSSASCTPTSVFGTLMRMHVNHLKKLPKIEHRIATENKIAEVMEKIPTFPANLNLEDQGLFAIGYYHQKQHLYSKKKDQGETE